MDPYQTFSPGFSAPGSPDNFIVSGYTPTESPMASPQRGRSRPSTNDKEAYGLNLGMLRKWHREKKDELLSSEAAKQEIAVSKVRGFLDAVGCVVRIQSWWRMMKPYHAFLALKRAQRATKAVYYRALRLYWKSERLYRVQIFGKFFLGWREEARTAKKLKSLITQFFKICIQRLRLTPQACMAFFNPGEWSSAVAKEDMLKIRRLMLEKLFHGWRSETVFLRMVRYKASQILSRTVRRTKGPLWVKESTLVCFHMWFRYIQVKKAYRHDLPDPRYTNPMLPQWTKLMKDITVNRIKRKRTRELGMQLTQLRSFKSWKRLMTVDRTKPVTPLAVAIMHYSTVLMTKVLLLWHGIIRERGKMMRFRTKIFQTWRKWAPKHKQMREFNDKAQELIRLKLVQRAYGVMIKLCFNVIGTRTERIKELRRNFCDRRVVICAYALLHKDSHVMMVDCWRRLYFYWKSRRNWKSVIWHYTYEWHAHKMKVIFLAWKSLTQPTHSLPSGLFNRPHTNNTNTTTSGSATNTPQKPSHPPVTTHNTHNTHTALNLHPPHSIASAVSSTNTSVRSHGPYISETESESENATPRGTLSRADSTHSVVSMDSVNSVSTMGDEPGALYSRSKVPALGAVSGVNGGGSGVGSSGSTSGVNSARDETGSSPPKHSHRRTSFRGKVTFTSPYHPRGLLAPKEVNYEKLVRDFVPKGLNIVQKGLEGKLGTKLSGLQFRTFCYALSRSYAQLSSRLSSNSGGGEGSVGGVMGSASHVSGGSVSAGNSVVGGLATPTTPNPTTPTPNTAANNATLDTPSVYARVAAPHALTTLSTTSTNTAQLGPTANTSSATDTTLSAILHFPVHLYFNRALQEKLQNGIDEVNMDVVLQAVSEGAVIETQHLRQIGQHIGDAYMPLFTLLLTNSAQFFADRVVKQDSHSVLMDIQNPILAYLTGAQIERWNRHDITYRESMHMTENLPTQRYLSGEFASYYLMRFIILKNIDLKARKLLHLCVMLPESRTVDQEVPEVLKRQKLAKLYRLRKSLTEMIGGDDSFQETYLHAVSNIPPLVRPANRPVTPPYAHNTESANKDIYTVLREFTLLTGKLTTEAKSLRQPLMERDDRLIANGFLRGARADYLSLKEACMTDKQRAERDEKLFNIAEKERKQAEKAKLKERKRRDKAAGISSKKHKKKNGKSTGPTDLNFEQMDNEAASSGDEGYLSDYNNSNGTDYHKLTFLEGGLSIGEERDIQYEVDFMARTAQYKHPVYIEVWQRPNWREMSTVRSAIIHNMVVCMRSSIKRILDVLQSDKTIGTLDYTSIHHKYNALGAFLINHVLANVPCRRSATWYVLPKEYWSFKTVRERVNVEIALADATVHSIRSQLNTDHHDNYYINNDIAKYQKFLKQTRKEILVIAEKRANKSNADIDERAPFASNIKKCDVKIRGAEKAIEMIRDKLRRAEFQVAAGNATGAGEVFIPPVVPEEPKKGKKAPEAAVITYDFKTVYAMIDAANTEIDALKATIAEQQAKKKEGENTVRMYDWQCQRTSRMLRDLAESRFQTMIDVQLIAVREAKRLDSTQDHQDLQSVRYKQMKRYARQLVDFLEGPIADRAAQLAREAEMRRVSELMNRSPASSSRAEFGSKDAAMNAARDAGAKKRGVLTPFSEEMSPVPSFRSALSNLSDTDLDRPVTAFSELYSGGALDELSLDESNYSYEQDDISLTLERSMRNRLDTVDVVDTTEAEQDTRTSSQIAVDRELELAHFNSATNRSKRELELKLLAEEQARELASQDLRIRVFEEYWTALPQNMERVQRKKNKEVQEEVLESEESSVVAEAEVANEHLTRTQRTWKSIGAQYWRSKEALVTELVQSGQEIVDMHLKFRAIDPLDEDLNEAPVVKIMVGNEDEGGPAVAHARDVNKLHGTTAELWKSTAHSDHQMMLSVSMKEVNEHEDPAEREKDGQSVGGGGIGGRQSSDGSIGRAPSTGVSRQPSSVSRQPSDLSVHTTHTNHTNATSTANRAVKPVKPDPFALVARDEHLRFVDRSVHPFSEEHDIHAPIKPIGSYDTQHESELLHAELGVIVTKHHHLPTLVEGERFATELDGVPRDPNKPLSDPNEDNEDDDEQFEDFRTASASFLKFNESLGLPGNSNNVPLVPPSPDDVGSTKASATFDKFDKIFDQLSNSIVGALEEAFPTTGDDGSALSEPTVLSGSGKIVSISKNEQRKRRGTLVNNPADSAMSELQHAIAGIVNDPHNITNIGLSVDVDTTAGVPLSTASSTASTPHVIESGKSFNMRDKAVSFTDKAQKCSTKKSAKNVRSTVVGGGAGSSKRGPVAHTPLAAHSLHSESGDSESDSSVSEISRTKSASVKGRKQSVTGATAGTPSGRKMSSAGSARHTVVTPQRGARSSVVSPLGAGGVSAENSAPSSRLSTPTRRTTQTPTRTAHATHTASKPSTPLRRASSPAHNLAKQASGKATPTQRSRANTLNSSTSGTSASNKYGIEEGSEASTHTPPPLELTASRAASRAKMEFSDELLPSGRDPYEDDVTSEISMEVYNSEQGIVAVPRVPGLLPSADSVKSNYTAGSRQPSGSNSMEGSPVNGGNGNGNGDNGGSGADSGRDSTPPFNTLERSNTFKVSVDKLMETMSLEPQMPEHYLPEKEIRTAIFGEHLDTGAAGLVAFLQSFASNDTDTTPVKKVKKPAPVVVEQGFVAVPMGGEWVLQPSQAEKQTYSPKILPFSPKAGDNGPRGGQYASPTQVLSVPKEAAQSFLLEGTAMGSPARPEPAVMAVPALSPTDSRRLALKLGFDPSSTTTPHHTTHPYSSTANAITDDNPDLLSMVREFYLDKQAEQEKLAKLEEKATISYFPSNFRQNRERAKNEDLSLSSGFAEYDDSSDREDVYNNNNTVQNEHSRSKSISRHADNANDTNRRPSLRNSTDYNNAEIMAAVAAVGGNVGRSFGGSGNVSTKTTTNVVLPSTQSTKLTTHSNPNSTVTAITTTTTTTRKPSTDSGSSSIHNLPPTTHNTTNNTTNNTATNNTGAPTNRLSVKMQEMLSRRGSYNPAEVRLELLEAIHDDQMADTQLDNVVSSAVREVKKYLHDREEEAHRTHPTGKLRTRESFAQAYRGAVQGQNNPYKQQAVTRGVVQLQETQAMQNMHLQRRNTGALGSPPGSPKQSGAGVSSGGAAHTALYNTTNTTDNNAEERRDSELHLTDAPLPSHPDLYSQHQHALLQDNSSYDAYAEQYAYMVNRAGTPEFWVDVAKIVPTTTNATRDDQSGISGGYSGVSEERRVMFDDTHNTSHPYNQYNTHTTPQAPYTDYTYGQESVQGYVNDTTSKHPLALSIDAVKLPHPVSSAVDPKTIGQYNLYRSRSPLRSPPRSREGVRDHTHNAHTSHANANKKKGMVYSHSDGMLLHNAVVKGTKMSLTTHLPTDTADDHTTGSDTFLSPIQFNLSLKPFSPPALSAPVPYFGSMESDVEGSGGVSGTNSHNNSSNNIHHKWRLDTSAVVVEGKTIESVERPPRTPSRLSRMNSREVVVSGVNTVPTSAPPSPTSSTLRGNKAIVLPSAFSLPEPAFAFHAEPDSTRDYRTSASAAKIISEIAGENYLFGMGVHTELNTGNNSISGMGMSDRHSGSVGGGGDVYVHSDGLVVGGALESTDTNSIEPFTYPNTDKLPEFNLSPTASPTASHNKHYKRVATKTTNLVFSPDSADKRTANNTTDNYSVNSNSTFSFNLAESESDALGERLKLPKVHTNHTNTTATSTNNASAKDHNFISSARRLQETTPLDALVVVPQSMPGLNRINDLIVQKAGNLKTVGPMSKAAQQAMLTAQARKNSNKGGVVLLKALSTEVAQGSAISDLDSVPSHHESMNMPAPVNKVEFVLHDSHHPTAQPAHHAPQQQAQHYLDSQQEAQMEADIEAELRQMLHHAHNEDAAEAYRQAYYRQNKEHLSHAGVVLRDEVNPLARDNPGNVPFVAGSKGRGSNTNVSAVTGGLNAIQRIQMSSSVGGGGFSGRGNGVLHKVKGGAKGSGGYGSGSASTTQLPPLDPTVVLSVETPFADPAHKTLPHKTLPSKTSSGKAKNTKFAVTEEILHQRQVLSALLNHTTADMYELDRPLDPNTYVTGTVSSKTKVGVDTLQASKSNKIFSKSSGSTTTTPTNTTTSAAAVATNTAKSSVSESRKVSNPPTPTGGQLLLTRHGSRKGSMDSISSMGSVPLQNIHTPTVEINNHTHMHNRKH